MFYVKLREKALRQIHQITSCKTGKETSKTIVFIRIGSFFRQLQNMKNQQKLSASHLWN